MTRSHASNLSPIRELAAAIGFKPIRLIPATLLAAGAAAFEALSMSLLLPAAQASVRMDFGIVRESDIFGPLVRRSPRLASLKDQEIFLLLLTAVLAASIIKMLLVYLSSVAAARQAHDFSSSLRRESFDRVVRSGKLFFDHANLGHLQHVVLTSSERIALQMTMVQEILASVFMLGAYLAVMLTVSWRITVVLVVFYPIVHNSAGWLISGMRDASQRLAEARRELNSLVANVVGGIVLVKTCANEDGERAQFAHLSSALDGLQWTLDRKAAMVKPLQEALFLLMMLLLLFALPFIGDAHTAQSVPGLLVFVYLTRRASISVMMLGRLKSALAMIDGSVRESLALLDPKDKFQTTDGTIGFEGLRTGIRFQGLEYAFPNGLKVLRGVSFVARKGEMTAIVGPSGAGKTTLFNLLLKLYEAPRGAILLDELDVRDASRESLAERLALVNQDALLFNDTIRNNLGYALSRLPTDAALMDALRRVRLSDFVERLPHGLDTFVGDRGAKLSGGEKQRLAIARAMLRGADVLLLDEATSSLDSETESLLQQSIEALVEGKTSLVIAHRLSTIKNADRIVVLDDGVVREEGPFELLLSSGGAFRRLWEAQGFR